MLGKQIADPQGQEAGGVLNGMGLLPVTTQLQKEKVRRQTKGRFNGLEGVFSALSGLEYAGYEIHMGHTNTVEETKKGKTCGGAVWSGANRNVYGTYIHGIFDRGEVGSALVNALASKKGVRLENCVMEDYRSLKERQYDTLADTLRNYLDMEKIYGILRNRAE